MNAVDAVAAQEEAFFFDCAGDALLGVLHRPALHAPAAAATTGVVVIVGGPQYRAGSHRQFVLLARQMAAAGHPVLRFDARGMGDSSGAVRNFEQISADIGAAIDELIRRQPTAERVVLWGLCDGASAALLYVHERGDQRVRGLCLLNPWVRSDASLARTRVKHYYLQRLLQREFWLKLLRGQVAIAGVNELLHSLRHSTAVARKEAIDLPFQTRMALAWKSFAGIILLVLSDKDYTALEFKEVLATQVAWKGAADRSGVQACNAIAADHTFSGKEGLRYLQSTVMAWLRLNFVQTDSSAPLNPNAVAELPPGLPR